MAKKYKKPHGKVRAIVVFPVEVVIPATLTKDMNLKDIKNEIERAADDAIFQSAFIKQRVIKCSIPSLEQKLKERWAR